MPVSAEDVAAVAVLFRAVDKIDADIRRRRLKAYPMQGATVCAEPNCGGTLVWKQYDRIRGAGTCTRGCVHFDSAEMRRV